MQVILPPDKHPQELAGALAEVTDALKQGKLVAFPTETVYGVGAVATNDQGYDKLVALKSRPGSVPFAIHMGSPDEAGRYVDLSSPMLKRLIRRVFPGPVTLVLAVSDETIKAKCEQIGLPIELADRIYHNNTVGLRCPDHPSANFLLNHANAGGPVLASSANLRGQEPPKNADDVLASLGQTPEVEYLIDGGQCTFARPSTVVRVTENPNGSADFLVEREGVFDEPTIRRMLQWTLLLVCSGNTCRSPMAEVLAQKVLAEDKDIPIDKLADAGIRVLSAGTSAMSGMPATEQAQQVMARMGLDLSTHRSRSLSAEMIRDADVVYCMTESHRQGVLSLVPDAGYKVELLDSAGDISDPYGSDVTTYARCAEVIRRRLAQRLKEQQV
jgi:protein-tyrosine phosphatase